MRTRIIIPASLISAVLVCLCIALAVADDKDLTAKRETSSNRMPVDSFAETLKKAKGTEVTIYTNARHYQGKVIDVTPDHQIARLSINADSEIHINLIAAEAVIVPLR